MLLGYVGYYLVRGNLSVAIPLLSQEFGYSNTELAIILTFSEVAYAVGKFTTGPLADQIGGKKVFLLGMAGAIVCNLLFPLQVGIVYFTVVWCVCRYFLSMGWGCIIKAIGEWYEPERHGTVMGFISINFQFGSVVASVFCGWLIAMQVGWKGLFFIPAMVVIGVFIWAALASRETPQDVVPGVRFGKSAGARASLADLGSHDDVAPPALEIIRRLLKIELFRQVLVFSFFSHLLRSIFLFWTPKFLVDQGMGNVGAAMSSAVFPLLGCLGTIFIGWYTDRHSKNGDRTGMMAVMLAGLFLSLLAISFLVPYGTSMQAWIVVLLGLSGFCLYGPYSMSAGALTLDIAGAKGAGTCTGMIDGVGYIGGAVAAWTAGVLADRIGWSQVFLFVAVCALFTVFWTLHMSRSHHRRAAGTAVTACLLLGMLTGCSSVATTPKEAAKIEVHGHRGSRGTRPENTIPAFEEALRAGADVLEMDLGVTRDGVLVIYHDQRINPVICRAGRGATRPVPIHRLTLRQLKTYDCGALRNPRFPQQVATPGTRIPTLDEFFEWVKASSIPGAADVRFNIEMKSEEAYPELAPPPMEFARLLVETLRRQGMLSRTIIQSFDFRTLREARKLAPDAILSALIEDRPKDSLVELARSAGQAQVLSPHHVWLTREDVAAAHAAGIQVVPWTANSAADWNRLAEIGVDAIITDDPRAALEWRRR
jgi:sugar phosphate permease/glycerophosphoryl diester phosphodiesterase